MLRAAAGYADRPADFVELIKILDNDLRMVTPVDPSAVPSELEESVRSTTTTSGSYQLSDDFLVSALRHWLTRKEPPDRPRRSSSRPSRHCARRPPRRAGYPA